MTDRIIVQSESPPDKVVITEQADAIVSATETERIVVTQTVNDHGHQTGLADDDHLQYVVWVKSATQPENARVGTLWIPEEP